MKSKKSGKIPTIPDKALPAETELTQSIKSPNQKRLKKLESLAEKLGHAWLHSSLIEESDLSELPENREEAYFIQDRMAEVIREPLSGWKVGATSTKMRELDGHDDVIPGRIFQSVTFVGPVHTLPFSRFPNARAETEFAFRLRESILVRKKPWTPAELKDKAVLHPAIEIIGNRHQLQDALKSAKSLITIADNGGGIGFVFGEGYENWQHLDFRNHTIRLQVDENPPAENFLGEMRCDPLEALADLVNHLRGRKIALEKGDFISTGAATVPQPFGRGARVKADFGVIGSIEVVFA